MQVLRCIFFYSFVYLEVVLCDKGERCYPAKGVIKRNFYVGEHDLPFKIEVSRRISHQLVSHIVRILLEEVLGYQHVYLVEEDSDSTIKTLQKISTCEKPDSCQPEDEGGPELTINFELWLPPRFNLEKWIYTQRVEDCGPLGPIGRYGWFVQKSIVDLLWNENFTVVDHYRAFLNTEITRYFDLSTDTAVVNKARSACLKLTKPNVLDCESDGFYISPKCKNTSKVCATLLADYPASTFHLLKEVINRHGLYVNVAWLGEDFEDTLLKIMPKKSDSFSKYVLFYDRKPSMLSSMISISPIIFPGCEDDSWCDFEVNQAQKVVWSEVKSSAPHAFYLIRAISFEQSQYTELLNAYYKGINRGNNIQVIACEWLKNNDMLWFEKWIPDGHKEKTILYIGGIFPIKGVYWNQNSVVEAAKMAADAINNRSSILEEYQLKILEQDGHCQTDEVMTSFIHYVKSDSHKTMVGILGPACSDTVEPIAGVAKPFNTIIISYSAEGTLFNSREKYPFFFRTIPENNMFRFVYLKLFQKLGYQRIAALTEDGQKYPEYLSYLQDLMESEKMTFIMNRKFLREKAFTGMIGYLMELKKKEAKIIIGDFYDYAARSAMCSAYRLHMTAANGYIWFLPSWFPEDWYDTDTLNVKQNATEQVPCSTEEMVKAINGHMSLGYKSYADPETIMQENRTVQKWRHDYRAILRKKNKIESGYGGYTYDAVWVYAFALDVLFKENKTHVATLHSRRTSSRLIELIQETNFNGVSGHLYFRNGSRISDIIITQWINRSRSVVGIYKASSPDEGELDMNETNIIWLTPNGQKPEDGSKVKEYCEVETLRVFFNIKCSTALKIANGIGITGFLMIIVVVIACFKYRYDKRMEIAEERMKQLGLLSRNVPFALDEWELPRENIVMNRKLGGGAFGNVYGGEAKVKNKGWIAVAVKTLKRGAKPEEKLDFLSEAEVMKQFDHINIVKLVGVCTTGEPVYTVMEFMLYGDLKTYLLDRRSMVSEKERYKTDEVSDKRLTNMALDIARGLSYLADKKFVHRDLACRNCLVNTSRSVKIADFGMCRPMFDHDYYRHNKKGMLPIRWMAPESLIDGLFTPMSDVWSYGVVLYEIITFASFPYQGFSHEQVLAHVKSHKTLPIPPGCKPQLEQLLRKCWSSLPQNRPHAAEIVEILALNPELITPCLDLPASSVEMDDSAIHDNDRARHSFSSVWQHRKSGQHDQSHLGIFDTSQLSRTAQETSYDSRHIGYKHLNARSLHESFKKVKRNQRDKTIEFFPQITYL